MPFAAWESAGNLYPEEEFCLYAPEIFRAQPIIMPDYELFGNEIVTSVAAGG